MNVHQVSLLALEYLCQEVFLQETTNDPHNDEHKTAWIEDMLRL